MMENIADYLSRNLLSSAPPMIGYSDEEIDVIQSVYDVRISGQFKCFLSQMGRSDGGVIGDYEIPMYRSDWRLRDHLLFQYDFFCEMQSSGRFEFLNKPFVFAFLSENQYCFLQTASDHPDAVYRYDSVEDEVVDEGADLLGYLRSLAEDNGGKLFPAAIGNLLALR